MGGSPSTSRRSAKIPWSLTRRVSAGTRHRAGVTDWFTQPHAGDAFPTTESSPAAVGRPGSPGLRVGMADRQRRQTEMGPSMGCPCWGLSPRPSYMTPEGRAAWSHRTGSSSCTAPSAFSTLGLHPVHPAPSEVRQQLAARVEGWRPCCRKSRACLCPHRGFPGKE